jgi:hypothetical protein
MIKFVLLLYVLFPSEFYVLVDRLKLMEFRRNM